MMAIQADKLRHLFIAFPAYIACEMRVKHRVLLAKICVSTNLFFYFSCHTCNVVLALKN